MRYIYQEYPKCKYHWTGETITVGNSDQEAALGGGWADTPDAFIPYKGPRQDRSDREDPLKWVDEWSVCGLSSHHRRKLKAQLLKAHSAFWKAPDGPSADVNSLFAVASTAPEEPSSAPPEDDCAFTLQAQRIDALAAYTELWQCSQAALVHLPGLLYDARGAVMTCIPLLGPESKGIL